MDRPTLKHVVAQAALATCLLSGCTQLPHWAHNPFSDPIKDREMRYSFAQVVEKDGNLHKAEMAYRQLQKEAPKNANYAHRLGVTLVREGRIEEGLVELRKAADLKPEDVAILNDLGYTLVVSGEYEAAESVLRKAMGYDQRNPRTINNLALALGYDGRTQEAYELFRRHGTEAEARSNLAYLLAQRGQMDHAMREYNLALNKDPSHKPAAEALLQLTEIQRDLNTLDSDVQYAGKSSTNLVQQVHHKTVSTKVETQQSSSASGNDIVEPDDSASMVDLVELVQSIEATDEAEASQPQTTVPTYEGPRVSGPMGVWMMAPAK